MLSSLSHWILELSFLYNRHNMSLQLAIYCSNRLYAEGLKTILADEKDIQIVGIFDESNTDILQSLKEILQCKPDVILAEFQSAAGLFQNLPENHLSDNALKILLIGDNTVRLLMDRQMKELVMKGVVGILPRSADSDILKKAVKALSRDEVWLDRAMLLKILISMKEQESNVVLGNREREIMFHICKGFHNKEIAQKLNISEQTVKSHCNRLYRKLGVSDRLQLVLYSHRLLPDLMKEH
jgi:DNA-binding NarL/FixJ family response regulator